MSNEDERAQKFVERHFPVTAQFLATEHGEGPAPIYGPTDVQNAHDDQPEPHVVVHVACRMSRWELLAALAAGYATTNIERSPDDMTVQQIRYDVEAQLSGSSWRSMEELVEEVAGTVERGEHPEQMAALKRAIDRAYPPRRPEPVRKPPRYGDGTVTLDTFDQGDVTVPEPTWCTGHGWQPNPHRSDITHKSVQVKAGVETEGHGWVGILLAYVSHAPHLTQQPELHPVVSVELDVKADFTAEEIVELNRGLHLAVIRLARLAAEALHLRDGAQ